MDDALRKKMMLDKFQRVLVIDKPEDVRELDGLVFDTAPDGAYDLALRFAFSLDGIERAILEAAKIGLINADGYLYLAYPKKGNKRYTESIDRDDITARFDLMHGDGYVAGTTLKFSKMLSFSDVFTIVGLRNFPNRDHKSSAASACVDDYIERIPDLREALSHRPEILALYDALPYGYQKDWARQVYSAKTEATREKRLLEMADILSAGYRSKDLFRQAKR